jgi:hypothetical protein
VVRVELDIGSFAFLPPMQPLLQSAMCVRGVRVSHFHTRAAGGHYIYLFIYGTEIHLRISSVRGYTLREEL